MSPPWKAFRFHISNYGHIRPLDMKIAPPIGEGKDCEFDIHCYRRFSTKPKSASRFFTGALLPTLLC